ncbi:MAG: glutamate--tRNA ligase [Candidatus Magasanikbacteria bacterium]|nr:glutamate--tRNA ligase [Candidatus Magasanikbacteria bacterium]
MVRTRFAPSPTGKLHVGGLRTALYAYLVAKQNGGQFLLRIEDTDRGRFVETGTMNILQSLYWAGIVPDEGVVLQDDKVSQIGDKGPYIQSERLPIYKKYTDELLAAGNAYYCFCANERLEEVRQFQQKNKLPTGYDGRCLKLEKKEVEAMLAAGENSVVRLKMPKTGETVWNDLVRGVVKFKNELVDDQVLLKSDGFPTYHLAVVVDDHLMEISHVVRGEEWVSSTPKHLQLYAYFGWQPPQFAHLPLLLNADKSKLSKRQGDVAVEDYCAKGYLPEAIVNFVAFLGWNPGTEKEIYSMDELIKDFSLEKVSKAGAVFNVEKLDWFNREYLKRLSSNEVTKRALPWFEKSDYFKDQKLKIKDREWLAKVVVLEKDRVITLADLPQAVKFIFELPGYQKDLLIWRKGTIEEVQKILPELKESLNTISIQDWNKLILEQKVGEWIKQKMYSTGSVLWPLRVSLSGQQNSPGPDEIAEVLGKDETLRRLDVAIVKLSS